MPHYKLTYFPLRGRGEFIRLLFAMADVPFENVVIKLEDWPKVKPTLPLGQVPILNVDGNVLLQSEAIGRYLAREFDLAGRNNWEMAELEMYVDGVTDMQNALQTSVIPHKFTGNVAQELISSLIKKIEWEKFRDEKLKPFMAQYSKFLERSRSGWFVGDAPTLADIRVGEWVERMDSCFQPGLSDSYPLLKRHYQMLYAIPQLAMQKANRPHYPF